MEQSTLLIIKYQLLNNQHYSSIQISYGTNNITHKYRSAMEQSTLLINKDQLWNYQRYSSIKISYGTINIIHQ